MADDVLPITHSIVDANALGVAIQRHYRLPDPLRCELLTRGMNDVYLVRSAGTRYAARLWRANLHTDAAVGFEMDLLAHLKAEGIPIVPGIDAADGSRFFAIEAPEGRRQVGLFPWVPGCALSRNATTKHAARLGEIMAAMHLASRSFRPKAPRPIGYHWNIRDKNAVLFRRLHDRPDVAALFRAAIPRVIEAMERVVPTVPGGPLHGDIHARNAFVAADDSIQVLDFDTCGEASFLHDLASFEWATHYIALDKSTHGLGQPVNDAFLAGYRRVRPFTAAEEQAFALFVAAKELSFISGISTVVNVVGHGSFRHSGWDWFVPSVRRHIAAAGLGTV